jgi:hypothetical protein
MRCFQHVRSLRGWACAAVLLGTTALSAQSVPESVSTVLTGGVWSADGRTGTYRVVIVREGRNPTTSRAYVEWLAETPDGLTVATRAEPKLPFGNGVATLQAAMRVAAPGRVQIRLAGRLAADPTQQVQALVVAGPPGKMAVASVRRRDKPGEKDPGAI